MAARRGGRGMPARGDHRPGGLDQAVHPQRAPGSAGPLRLFRRGIGHVSRARALELTHHPPGEVDPDRLSADRGGSTRGFAEIPGASLAKEASERAGDSTRVRIRRASATPAPAASGGSGGRASPGRGAAGQGRSATELELVPGGNGRQLEQRSPTARVAVREVRAVVVPGDLEQVLLDPVVEPRAAEDELAQPVDE